ncbi:efflux RND transporter periplasmic adaptor subunit [Acuticoccus sp.]|uniref:efflux RND transporter periplasmic adaptor subunit n=1 Tax=Acuticoccus sp. TaxID=1904378 RepID=UPI003B5226A9
MVALVAAVAAVSLAGCQPEEAAGQSATGGPPPAPSVTVAEPVVREVVEDDEFVGRFEAVDEVAVRARVGGYLDEVHFTDGQLVEEGELLFTIDQRPFRTELERAEAQLRTANAQLDYARAQFERAEDLVGRGTIPTATYEERQEEFLSAQAAVDAAQAAHDRAALDMEYTEIRAPLDGRIDRRLVSVGNLVQPDQTVLTTIVSLDPIDFYFDIDERALLGYARDARSRGGALQLGAGDLQVRVRLADEEDGPFQGTLNFAENRIDEASGTARLRARFDNADGVLQPGMFGRVNVPASLPYQGVLVPDEAVASDQSRRIVYVLGEDNTVSAKPVRPGPRIHGYRVIREGLTGEETIVINGLSRVRPGVTVDPEMVELPPEAASVEG